MISVLHRSLALLLAAAVPAAAQRILVVDRLNRPGAQFTDLPAAEAAAQDGDTLVLRSDGGTYSAIQTSKALSIVCDIGQAMIRASAIQPFQIAGIPANRSFALKSCLIYFDATFGAAPGLQVAYCQGRVHLDTIEIGGLGQPQLDLLFSSVTIKESRMTGLGGVALSAFGCFLDVCASQFQGSTGDSRFSQPPTEAVALDACDANFTASGITGGMGDQGFAPSPAITVRNSRLDLGTGGSPVGIRAGYVRNGGNGTASAVVAQSSVVRVDPGVSVLGQGAPPYFGVVPVVAPVPSLSGFGIRFLSLRYQGVPGAATFTIFGLSGGPLSSSGFLGGLWVDPRLMFIQPGVVDTLQFQIPIGLTVVAQVLSVAPGQLDLSNAVAITGR